MTLHTPNPSSAARHRMPRGVWVLGFVSMLMDISSEMIHSLLPLFLVAGLGASVFVVGIIEGAAEAIALIVRVFSGTLSDYLGRRKGLAVIGYGLGAICKPFFAMAESATAVTVARWTDRVGKGIRGAPRDALLADITPSAIRGAAFGLRQSLDTFGAFLGPLVAAGLMLLWANDFRAVFWVAAIPAVLSVALLAFGLKEERGLAREKPVHPLKRESLAQLSSAYWWVVAVGAVFTLARFSEAFLLLKAESIGISLAMIPLVLVAMNVVYAVAAYPFGWLADRVSHIKLLALGLVVLIVSDVVLASAADTWGLMAGVMLWGVHMAMTQGLLAAMVAHTAPAALRGTAYGFFNLACGVAMFLASAIAGLLWTLYGPDVTFMAGAGFCVLTLAGLVFTRTSRAHYPDRHA